MTGRNSNKLWILETSIKLDGNVRRVCELIKTIYSLKQSGCEWNHKLDTKLENLSYTWLYSNPCTYVWCDGENTMQWRKYLHNHCLGRWSPSIRIRWRLNAKNERRNQGLIGSNWYGRAQENYWHRIDHTDNTITISQQSYIESILKCKNLTDCNHVSTPMYLKVKILPNPEGNEGSRSNYFTQLLGELKFLANATRPDITFAVNIFPHTPQIPPWNTSQH